MWQTYFDTQWKPIPHPMYPLFYAMVAAYQWKYKSWLDRRPHQNDTFPHPANWHPLVHRFLASFCRQIWSECNRCIHHRIPIYVNLNVLWIDKGHYFVFFSPLWSHQRWSCTRRSAWNSMNSMSGVLMLPNSRFRSIESLAYCPLTYWMPFSMDCSGTSHLRELKYKQMITYVRLEQLCRSNIVYF